MRDLIVRNTNGTPKVLFVPVLLKGSFICYDTAQFPGTQRHLGSLGIGTEIEANFVEESDVDLRDW